ncbi:putative phosphopantothenoylcysteine decarboxylase [Clarias magur]|uniref:Putative phosphopantothenoylcysteine decarboxylase n=1 Tax=Clarias magur TaxID=1594786 RepID=A0A8J4U1I6_CLAMG|nr:putative phosphopantothenoylcysteine decarboxylase [Clarias magur]
MASLNPSPLILCRTRQERVLVFLTSRHPQGSFPNTCLQEAPRHRVASEGTSPFAPVDPPHIPDTQQRQTGKDQWRYRSQTS